MFITIILLNLELVYIPIAILSYNVTFMCAVLCCHGFAMKFFVPFSNLVIILLR